MTEWKKGISIVLLLCFLLVGAVPVYATNEFDDFVKQVEALPDFSQPEEAEELFREMWNLFLASPEDFAAAMATYEWKDLYRTSELLIRSLRTTEKRETEIAAAVRSLDLLSMNEVQQRFFFRIIYETETRADREITDIANFNYPLLFGKMRYMDGGIVPLYDTHIQTVFTMDPAAYIAALSKEPKEDWDRLAMGTAYAYEFEDDFIAFRKTLSNLSKEERSEAEREVIALLQKHCENRTSLLPGSNPDMVPKTADVFNGIAAVLVMGLSALACVTLIRKMKYA